MKKILVAIFLVVLLQISIATSFWFMGPTKTLRLTKNDVEVTYKLHPIGGGYIIMEEAGIDVSVEIMNILNYQFNTLMGMFQGYVETHDADKDKSCS